MIFSLCGVFLIIKLKLSKVKQLILMCSSLQMSCLLMSGVVKT